MKQKTNVSSSLKGMYYRRKVLLGLLEAFGGKLGKTDFQKLLFLFTQVQEVPVYDFFPYRFGCYSAQANQDLSTLTKYGLLAEKSDGWLLTRWHEYKTMVTAIDRENLREFATRFKNLKGKRLVRYVYENHPEYAIKSEIAESLLSPQQWQKVCQLSPQQNEPALFTIGYEGKSVERYVTELIRENIKVLCDVRKNPFSMKFGFSKKNLKALLTNIGIDYVHFPRLGIASQHRQNLGTPQDYQNLFTYYEETILPANKADLARVAELFREKKRIALTCFEADHNSCHRSRTAASLSKILGKKTEFIHL